MKVFVVVQNFHYMYSNVLAVFEFEARAVKYAESLVKNRGYEKRDGKLKWDGMCEDVEIEIHDFARGL